MTNTAPGIFCYAGGAGQAAATSTYADQSVTYNQARPATPGSYLTFKLSSKLSGGNEDAPNAFLGHVNMLADAAIV